MNAPNPDSVPQELPWARWPWQRCKAVAGPGSTAIRCELHRRHEGAHAAERGMYPLRWIEVVR